MFVPSPKLRVRVLKHVYKNHVYAWPETKQTPVCLLKHVSASVVSAAESKVVYDIETVEAWVVPKCRSDITGESTWTQILQDLLTEAVPIQRSAS